MSLREKNAKMNKTKLKLFENLLYNNYKEQQKSIINNDSTTSKNEKINFPDIYSGLNKITPIKKQSINNSQEKNINIKKINKMFISNKSNNSNINNINILNKMKLSKIMNSNFSNLTSVNQIIDTFNSSNNHLEIAKISSPKDRFSNLTRNNLNYFKNITENNSLKLNNIRINYDNNNFESNSNLNALSENSSKNTNTTMKKTSSNHYIKTEVNNNKIKSPKDNNIKLILPNKNNFNKRFILNSQNNSLFESSKVKISKNSPVLLPLTVDKRNRDNSPIKIDLNYQKSRNLSNNRNSSRIKRENDIRTIKQNINDNIKYIHKKNISTIRTEKNYIISKDSFYNSNDYIKYDEYNSPEELHFYYIYSIQRGKKNENKY